jgi:hypothetical protein
VFGSAYLGGCLYENPNEVLIDGTAEDLICEAMSLAKEKINDLSRKIHHLQA